jgi:hypothetical protein
MTSLCTILLVDPDDDMTPMGGAIPIPRSQYLFNKLSLSLKPPKKKKYNPKLKLEKTTKKKKDPSRQKKTIGHLTMSTAPRALAKQPWKAVKEELESNLLPAYDLETIDDDEAFRSEPFYQEMLELGRLWKPYEGKSYVLQDPNGPQPFTDLIDRWLQPLKPVLESDYISMVKRWGERIADQAVTAAHRNTLHVPYVNQCKPLLLRLAFEVPCQTTHAAWIALAVSARFVLIFGNPELPTTSTLFLLMSQEYKRYEKARKKTKAEEKEAQDKRAKEQKQKEKKRKQEEKKRKEEEKKRKQEEKKRKQEEKKRKRQEKEKEQMKKRQIKESEEATKRFLQQWEQMSEEERERFITDLLDD